jgi:hypothetical protein
LLSALGLALIVGSGIMAALAMRRDAYLAKATLTGKRPVLQR